MTEKQPLNIDEIVYQWIVRKINLCSFETSKGTSVTIDNVQRIISEQIKEFIDNLPQESAYESGYQKWYKKWYQAGKSDWKVYIVPLSPTTYLWRRRKYIWKN